jgi:catechol 2,3-dioxygenase-like lactoylglutathione lyase family enzyme
MNDNSTLTIVGIDTVAVIVSDRRKALQWFRDVLGIQVAYIGPAEPDSNPSVLGSPENPGYWIELGSRRPMTRIHLCELEDHGVEPGPTGITFLTDNIQADYQRLKLKGVRFMNSLKQMEWGELLCEFLDPDVTSSILSNPCNRRNGRPSSHHPCGSTGARTRNRQVNFGTSSHGLHADTDT